MKIQNYPIEHVKVSRGKYITGLTLEKKEHVEVKHKAFNKVKYIFHTNGKPDSSRELYEAYRDAGYSCKKYYHLAVNSFISDISDRLYPKYGVEARLGSADLNIKNYKMYVEALKFNDRCEIEVIEDLCCPGRIRLKYFEKYFKTPYKAVPEGNFLNAKAQSKPVELTKQDVEIIIKSALYCGYVVFYL